MKGTVASCVVTLLCALALLALPNCGADNEGVNGVAKPAEATTPSYTATAEVIGFLSKENEHRHGIWWVGIPVGEVVAVKALQINGCVWEETRFITVSDGILILSEPNPLSIGAKYRVIIRAVNTTE